MENETGTPTSTENEVEETVEETTAPEVEVEETETEDDVETLKAKLAKAEEEKENQKRRAEKAEKKAKSSTQTEGLSETDIIFLAKTSIHDDDISDVTRWAKNDGISVKEAYERYKPILNTREEERKTALATATKAGARGQSAKPTGEDLLKKAETTGEVPDSDEGMAALAKARFMAGRK